MKLPISARHNLKGLSTAEERWMKFMKVFQRALDRERGSLEGCENRQWRVRQGSHFNSNIFRHFGKHSEFHPRSNVGGEGEAAEGAESQRNLAKGERKEGGGRDQRPPTEFTTSQPAHAAAAAVPTPQHKRRCQTTAALKNSTGSRIYYRMEVCSITRNQAKEKAEKNLQHDFAFVLMCTLYFSVGL